MYRQFQELFKIGKAINNVNFEALIDTGSNRNIITSTVFFKIGAPKLDGSAIAFQGFGNSMVTSFGSATLNLQVDSGNYKTEFHVVRDSDTCYEIVIGRELLSQSVLIVDGCDL